ncbi:MAG: M20/M25/M40 family metallo-hydrolase [Deltaproteobacteria bacterium]|nr:M20/M25/M40 family metallo-hydrolase [Deltaproteobacteria bacterium]
MSYQDAFKKVEQTEDYLVDVLQKIVAIDTSVPPGENYAKLVDAVEPEFKRFGFETERVTMPEDKVAQMPWPLSGPRVNLVADLRTDKPKASAYAHIDVVPIDEPWTRDPFGGELVDGKLYGRGTVDMKGSIACFLGAIKVLHEMGLEPHYSLNCLLCTDEELGVYPGARYLAEEGYFADHLIWLELGAMEPIVTIGAAGAIRIDVTAVGRSCHSGMNYLGVNAIEQLFPILDELLVLKKEVEGRLSRIPTFPVPGCPYDKMTPMFNLNIISGGTKENIVPGVCELTINRRYIVDERYDDVVAEIEEALRKGRERSKLEDLRVSFVHDYPPVECDPKQPAALKAMEAKKAVNGYENFIFGGISGSTDLGFVMEALEPRQVQVAGFGLLRATNMVAHAADEHVYVEDLVSMTKELVHYLAF